MLNIHEAARYATVSERTFRQWIADGLLPVIRIGAKGKRGHIRIMRVDIDALLASFRVTTKKPEPSGAPVSSFKHLKLS